MMKLKLEILKASWVEHTKFTKDFSYILDLDDPKRIKVLEEENKLSEKIRELENKIKNER